MEGNVEVDLEIFLNDSHPVVLSSFDAITGSLQTQPLFQLLSYMFRSYARITKFLIEAFFLLCLYQGRGRSLRKIGTCTLITEA